MSSDVMIAPSILSADLGHLSDEIADISSADLVHVDVMDGHFVPNLTWGPHVAKAARRATDLPIDVHLMVSNPDETIGLYLDAGADYLTFHVEAATHAHRLAGAIHDAGAKAGVALNPGTPTCSLDALIEEVDLVLVMTVNPGFGGQSFIPSTVRKIRQVRALCDERGVNPLIQVDGGITPETAPLVIAAGARVLVAGSAVFGKPSRSDAIAQIREAGVRGMAREA